MTELQGALQAPIEDAAQPRTICGRCGSFAQLYLLWGKQHCEACLLRRDPIETGPITARTLVLDSLRLCMRVALPATLIMLAFGSVSILLDRYQPLLVRLFDAFVMMLATATIQRLAFARIVHGPGASVGEALNVVVRRYGLVWGAHFLVNVTSALFALLLIVPGVLRALSYTLSGVMVLNEGVDAMSSLELSQQRMMGHRKATFLAALQLSFALIGAVFLGIVLISIVVGSPIVVESLANNMICMNAVFVGVIPLYLLPVVLQLKLAVPQPVRPAAIPVAR